MKTLLLVLSEVGSGRNNTYVGYNFNGQSARWGSCIAAVVDVNDTGYSGWNLLHKTTLVLVVWRRKEAEREGGGWTNHILCYQCISGNNWPRYRVYAQLSWKTILRLLIMRMNIKRKRLPTKVNFTTLSGRFHKEKWIYFRKYYRQFNCSSFYFALSSCIRITHGSGTVLRKLHLSGRVSS